MKKCSRVKNPCKICLQSVTKKTGVQCKGACKKWAHYTCLNFTPGKIQDIKAGIITITCPCPNCNTQEPKEFLTDPPYTCDNKACPANKLPTCQINECPLNDQNPVMSRGVSPQNILTGPQPCGPSCSASKKSSRHTPPTSSPEMTRIPPVSSYQPVQSELPPCASSNHDVPPCMSQSVVSRMGSPPRSPRMASTPPKTSRSPSQKDVYAENKVTSPLVKSQSCSCMSGVEGNMMNSKEMVTVGNQGSIQSNEEKSALLKGGDCKASCSDSKLSNSNNNKENQKVLLCTIHELCSTVGHLSTQIKDLMCKMMTDIEKNH